MKGNEKKLPIQTFKAGAVRAAIWENELEKDGKKFKNHSVQIDRTFKQGDEYKKTNSFYAQDLPKVALVAGKAFEYLSLEVKENAEDKE